MVLSAYGHTVDPVEHGPPRRSTGEPRGRGYPSTIPIPAGAASAAPVLYFNPALLTANAFAGLT